MALLLSRLINHPNSMEAFLASQAPSFQFPTLWEEEKTRKPRDIGSCFLGSGSFVACLGNSFLRLWPRRTEKWTWEQNKITFLAKRRRLSISRHATPWWCQPAAVATRWWCLSSPKTPCSAIRKLKGLLRGFFSRSDSITFGRVNVSSKGFSPRKWANKCSTWLLRGIEDEGNRSS